MTLNGKTDNAVILMNGQDYAGLQDSNNKKDQILLESIIRDKSIEGLQVIISNYVPEGTTIGGDLSNYAVGIAEELEITPKTVPGSLAKTFDASFYVAGKPIVAKDFYILKV